MNKQFICGLALFLTTFLNAGELTLEEIKSELQKNPYSKEYRFQLGQLYAEKGKSKDALTQFRTILLIDPDHSKAKKYFLRTLEKSGELSNQKSGQILLGLGTGRSGSTSLTMLWRSQEKCFAAHESPPQMPWKGDDARLEFHEKRLNLLSKKYDFVGDISHWWLPYFEKILEKNPSVKAVVLKRDKAETVQSFIRIKGGERQGAINHWIQHNGSYYSKNVWDECYPKYSASSIGEAVGLYWDEYYATVEKLVNKYPNSIRVFNTEELSDEKKQLELLRFCGFSSPKFVKDLQYNVRTIRDGANLF